MDSDFNEYLQLRNSGLIRQSTEIRDFQGILKLRLNSQQFLEHRWIGYRFRVGGQMRDAPLLGCRTEGETGDERGERIVVRRGGNACKGFENFTAAVDAV